MIVCCNALDCKFNNLYSCSCEKEKIVISAKIDDDGNTITECDDFERSEKCQN